MSRQLLKHLNGFKNIIDNNHVYIKQQTDLVEGNYIQYDNVKVLPPSLKNCDVKGIMLSNYSFGSLPKELYTLTTLEEVVISRKNGVLHESDIEQLKGLNLKSLSIIECGLTSCEMLNTLKTLEHLDLSFNRLTEVKLDLPNLKTLDVKENKIVRYSLPSSLKKFDISYNNLDNYYQLPQLEALDISNNYNIVEDKFKLFKECCPTLVYKHIPLDYPEVQWQNGYKPPNVPVQNF